MIKNLIIPGWCAIYCSWIFHILFLIKPTVKYCIRLPILRQTDEVSNEVLSLQYILQIPEQAPGFVFLIKLLNSSPGGILFSQIDWLHQNW
jgi:NAD(P)H-dependent FMN reductase